LGRGVVAFGSISPSRWSRCQLLSRFAEPDRRLVGAPVEPDALTMAAKVARVRGVSGNPYAHAWEVRRMIRSTAEEADPPGC
jgi:hypothetical protein